MPRTKGSKNKKIKKLNEVPGLSDLSDSIETVSDKQKEAVNQALDKANKPTNKEKLDKLKKLMNETNRERGGLALKFASEEPSVERIKFGIPLVDELTGGGVPCGRFSIIWGPKSGGKTTLCYRLIAEAQKAGKICAFIDLERTYDPNWAEKMGVDNTTLVLGSEYVSAEAALDDFMNITKSQAADLIILDSIQGLSPKGEQETKRGKEKSLEDDTMALLARKLSQFFRMASASVYTGKVAIVLIGQARTNLGGFVAFDTLSGGHALSHWSSLTLAINRGPKADAPTNKTKVDGKTQEEIIGFDTVIKLEKRKVESKVEGSNLHIPFYFDSGFLRESN